MLYNRKMEINKKLSEKERFSIVARAKSFTHAFRGIGIVIRTTHNFWIQIFLALIAIFLGFVLNISSTEWAIIILTIGFVLFAEIINTAFEFDIDLTSPEYHPYARDTKDVAAGAVLVSAIFSFVVAAIIFIPKILLFF